MKENGKGERPGRKEWEIQLSRPGDGESFLQMEPNMVDGAVSHGSRLALVSSASLW